MGLGDNLLGKLGDAAKKGYDLAGKVKEEHGDGIVEKLGGVAQKGMDLAGKGNDAFAEMQKKVVQKDAGDHTMFEVFSGGYITFALTENSLVYGKEEIPYSELEEIELTIPPTKLRVGAAETKTQGRTLLLQYALGQAEQFANAVSYANDQIAAAKGITRDYRYCLQSPDGTRIEAFDDYLAVYAMAGGFLGNTLQGKAAADILEYTDIDAALSQGTDGEARLDIAAKSSQGSVLYSVPVPSSSASDAHAIAALVTSFIPQPKKEIVLDPWIPVTPAAQSFQLGGTALEVSEGLDAYNAYRMQFRSYAMECSKAAMDEYASKVRDLVTFFRFFPVIYSEHLDILVKRAVEILISGGIYVATEDSFKERHAKMFHQGLDIVGVVSDAAEEAAQANQNAMRGLAEGITRAMPNFVTTGFSASDLLKDELYRTMRDGAADAVVANAGKLKSSQAKELFERIEPIALLNAVFSDYWCVYVTLVGILNENGRSIWIPQDSQTQEADNIFKNMTNPAFPQDKVAETLVQVVASNPYRKEFYQFMQEHFGETDEVVAIRKYFGFEDKDPSIDELGNEGNL